jgi:uncharacterized membrane protein
MPSTTQKLHSRILLLIKTALRLLLALVLLAAGISHLTWARTDFLAQVPRWVPLDGDLVVVLSGIAEIVLGIWLLLPRYRVSAGIACALFFIAIFPGNLAQYLNRIDSFGLDTDAERFGRLFFQPVLILWALWSCDALAVVWGWLRRRQAA